MTLQIYLNDVESGGETSFFIGPNEADKVRVNPTTGMVIIFQHDILHEGSPVNSGVKHVIRTDVMYRE